MSSERACGHCKHPIRGDISSWWTNSDGITVHSDCTGARILELTAERDEARNLLGAMTTKNHDCERLLYKCEEDQYHLRKERDRAIEALKEQP